MSVIYLYVLDVKKNFYYISVSVQTKKNLYVYICACAYKRENDAHFSLFNCVFRENCICVSVKKIEHLFSVNYYYFNEDIVCINPIDYANNHLSNFLLVTVKLPVKNRRTLFLFSYCNYFTFIFLFPKI